MAATTQPAPGMAWRLALGTEGRLSRRVHQRLEALWAAKRGQQGDKVDTAEALKAALDSGGEPWHVVIGPEGFVTNVRYRKERCFIFANKGAALRALVFQSSPLPEEGPAAGETSDKGPPAAPPKNVSVYASEWEDEAEEAAILALVADSLAEARADGTASSVAIKGALTARRGALWHVLVARDSAEMGASVEAHPGTFLDARVVGRGGAHRVMLWQHDLPLSLATALRLQLPPRAAALASLTCFAIALILTLLTQLAPLLGGITSLVCDPCCHPDASQRGSADCAGAACTPEAAAHAIVCMRIRSRLNWCGLGFLVAGFVLKMLGGPRVGKTAAARAAARAAVAGGARGRQGKAKRK